MSPKPLHDTRASNESKQKKTRTLPDSYFNGLLGNIIVLEILSFFFVITNFVLQQNMNYIFDFNFRVTKSIDLIVANLLLVLGYIILFLFFSYLRRRTSLTFKLKKELRVTILKRKNWKLLLQYIYSICVILIIFFMFFGLFLVNSSLPKFPLGLLSMSIASAILLRIFIILTETGLTRREELLCIIDSLQEFEENEPKKSTKKLKRDDQYLVEKFLESFGELLLSSLSVFEKVNLGNHLTPLLLARYWGNEAEKVLSKVCLGKLKENLNKPDWRSNIISWLDQIKTSFPRFEYLSREVTIKSKKVNVTKIVDKLNFIAIIATIGAFTITIIDVIIRFII